MANHVWWARPRPGEVAPWVMGVVASACVLAIVGVGAGAYAIGAGATAFLRHFEVGLRETVPPLVMALALGLLALPRSTTSRGMRLAVQLPIVHAITLVIALCYLPHLTTDALAKHAPYLEMLPVIPWFFSGLGLALVLAWAIGGRDWAHAFVTFALAFLLLFALWLPIASHIPARTEGFSRVTYWPTLHYLEANPAHVATIVFVPPLVIATIYTWFANRHANLAQELRLPIGVALGLLALVSVGARVNTTVGASMVHDNFTHLLLAALMLAIIATVTLSLSTWLAGRSGLRRASARRRDFVVSDHGPDTIATMQITSWLRGPLVTVRSFLASDGKEELRVPSGVRVVTAIPKHSSGMQVGDRIVLLSTRDRLRLGGLVATDVGESPFRSRKVTELGPDAVLAPAEPISTPVESMMLTAWRPSVAYLVIAFAAAVPSLLGLLVDPGW